jgi:PAS domain S-box-containing protein
LTELSEFGELLSRLDDPIALHSATDGSIVYANQRACEIAGCGPEEIRFRHVADFGFGASREETVALAAELMNRARQAQQSFNVAVQSATGDVTQLHMKLQPIKLDNRLYVLSVGRELGAEEGPLCLLGPKLAAIDVADEGLGVIDSLGRVRYVNPACAKLFGYDEPEQMVGQNSGELFEETDDIKRAMDEVVRRSSWAGVLVARRADGSKRPLRVRGWRTEGLSEGDGSYFVGSVSEVPSDPLKAPASWPGWSGTSGGQTLERLAELGQLACGVIHDLNNYLTLIVSYTKLGLTLEDLDPKLESYLRVIERAATDASRIPDFLLDVARQEPGAITVVSLNRLIERNRSLIENVVGNKGDVTFDLCDEECLARVDPVQLGQVLLNLSTNARDALGGSGALRVGLQVRDGSPAGDGAEASASIWFEDEGSGIPEDLVDKIFEPFFTTKPRGSGTGLGLTSAKRLVEANGGQMLVDSALGQGTRIDLVFPLVEIIQAS